MKPFVVGLFLAVVVAPAGLTACGGHSASSTEDGRFSALPKDCSALTTSISSEVEAFAGRIYDSAEQFSYTNDTLLAPAPNVQSMSCKAQFTNPSPSQVDGDPQSRNVDVSLELYHGQDSTGSATKAFDAARRSAPTSVMGPGVGDEAFTFSSGDPTSVEIHFRAGNLIVKITTSGKDYAFSPLDVGFVAELQTGAETIAIALAGKINSVVNSK